MHKRLGGYMTVEAACLIPLVLLLYLLILLAGFFMYDRCVISQDQYMLAFRGSRWTCEAYDYGEVIYGTTGKGEAEVRMESYIRERLAHKSGFYPLFAEEGYEEAVFFEDESVSVSLRGFRGLLAGSKTVRRVNPLEIVKQIREREGKHD